LETYLEKIEKKNFFSNKNIVTLDTILQYNTIQFLGHSEIILSN